jgi:hypothetical protein
LVSIFQLAGGVLTLVYSKTMPESLKDQMLDYLRLNYATGD